MTTIELPPQRELRAEICRVGRSLYERGYVHASAGNISARLSAEFGGGTLITPTDACLGLWNQIVSRGLARTVRNAAETGRARRSRCTRPSTGPIRQRDV